jgi:hypothetical protein
VEQVAVWSKLLSWQELIRSQLGAASRVTCNNMRTFFRTRGGSKESFLPVRLSILIVCGTARPVSGHVQDRPFQLKREGETRLATQAAERLLERRVCVLTQAMVER